MKRIYLDYAATTPLDKRVFAVMEKYSKKIQGNASSPYYSGQIAKKLLEESRLKIGNIIGVGSIDLGRQIVFTGSGTESDNLAIFGIARANKKSGKHIITSKIEHLAVLRACEYLENNEGFEVTYLDVESNGIINPETLKKALRPDTILVSIMYANNEIGTIQPIAKLAKTIRNFEKQIGHKIVFHTDACQAAGALDLNVQKLGVDAMTINGSKIYGPKGTGCLFICRGIQIEPIIVGGSQERGLRAGTENVPLFAGFAYALKLVEKARIKESQRLIKLRDYLISEILTKISGSKLNGDPIVRLPNNINISFSGTRPVRDRSSKMIKSSNGIDGEMLVLAMDKKGVEVSTSSACTSAETGPSHVLKALRQAQGKLLSSSEGNLRITLGRSTAKKDLDYFVKVLTKDIKS